MISTVILVHAQPDLVRGRMLLRAHVAAQNWRPLDAVRASAAFTALGDLILGANLDEVVPVSLAIYNSDRNASIELGCSLSPSKQDSRLVEKTAQRLRQVADAVEIGETAQHTQIAARLHFQS
ncbi:MAG: hypothetical protein K8J31_27410 [Anaerolineae bacterium]|jgi:hypothetical protein|nr:hypothetical protein [Anaerolineae bacterium]